MTDVASDFSPTLEVLLATTEEIFLSEGFPETTLEAIAQRSGQPLAHVREVFPDRLDAMVAMLNREFSAMYSGIASNIERDPRGGLLSKIYTYLFCEVYERPLARSLYLVDRHALRDLMSHRHGRLYAPSVEVREELVDALYFAGMLKPEVNTRLVSQALGVISGGLAITAPHDNLSQLVSSVMVWGAHYDADVVDTTPGKTIFYNWAASLENSPTTGLL